MPPTQILGSGVRIRQLRKPWFSEGSGAALALLGVAGSSFRTSPISQRFPVADFKIFGALTSTAVRLNAAVSHGLIGPGGPALDVCPPL